MREIRVVSVVGARPQFIKAAAIVAGIERYASQSSRACIVHHEILHSGQHYDFEMSQAFFVEFELPKPTANLGIGSGSHGVQTAAALEGIEAYLLEKDPDVVLVYGDTNTTLAAALAAVKQHIPLAHVEAGLREYKKEVPEEMNRILTDHMSSYLFCPTETGVLNLQQEGFVALSSQASQTRFHSGEADIPSPNVPIISNTGDVMVDVMMKYLPSAEKRVCPIVEGGSWDEEYLLATVHRAENTDDEERLVSIFRAFGELVRNGHRVVLPLHPRTLSALTHLDRSSELLEGLTILPPVPYLDMLALQKNAQVVLTDSGGLQKEAFVLGVPVVTLRAVSGWPETVNAGWNVLVDAETELIVAQTTAFLKARPERVSESFFGTGHAADHIVAGLVGEL